ncbi:MAG: hypothetical protein J5822_07225 [Eubacteriaceae bacterium]|nr:hypothetical protein [Eubacteriaceae bacterium]
MFKRTRIRFTAAITAGILIFLCLILAAVYAQSYFDTERNNTEKLDKYVRNYTIESENPAQPGPQGGYHGGGKNDPKEKDAGFLASAFYSVAFAQDGTVLRVDNSRGEYLSDDELVALAEEKLASGSDRGKSGELMYRIETTPGYVLVAFLNISNSRSVMYSLLKVILLYAAAALVILPAAAYAVSGAILRPLEDNDKRQKQFISDAGH